MIESVSRRAFSSSSGTYNVRASELARDRKLNIFNITVQFLDDIQHVFQIEVSLMFTFLKCWVIVKKIEMVVVFQIGQLFFSLLSLASSGT